MQGTTASGATVDWRGILALLGAAGLLLGVAAFLTRGGLSGFGEWQFPAFLIVLLRDAPLVAAWLIAAWGYGCVVVGVTRWIAKWADGGWRIADREKSPIAHVPSPSAIRHPLSAIPDIRFGLGVAILMWLGHAAGALGLLQVGGAVGAWAILAVGWLAAIGSAWGLRPAACATHPQAALTPSPPQGTPAALSRGWGSRPLIPSRSTDGLKSVGLLAAIPGLALLLVAAGSAPGWLWASEAHGYDVLSYHLQLPREWLAAGRIVPLEHNIYSFFPSYVEAAYYHLGALVHPFAPPSADGMIVAATAAQLLHAALAVWAALELLALLRPLAGPAIAAACAAIFLNTPWVVVTGSMAYNEMAVVGLLIVALRLACGLRLAACGPQPQATSHKPQVTSGLKSSGLLLGFILGVSIGAKLTACGFVLAPVALLGAMLVPARAWLPAISTALLGGAIALLPYAVRNFLALDWGNPLFPFGTGLFGSAHWSAEQVERWNTAHSPGVPWGQRLGELWSMAFLHAQWAWLWFLGSAALVGGFLLDRGRRRFWVVIALMLIVQIIFWLGFTHLQSRFLLPAIVPLLLALGIFSSSASASSDPAKWRPIALAALALAIGLWTITLYHRERNGLPATYIDGVSLRSGLIWPQLDEAGRRVLLEMNPDIYLSRMTDPAHGIYLIGDATPFYILRPVVYHTTWDRSPLGDLIRTPAGMIEGPPRWADELRGQGIRMLFINFAELHRLSARDGWYDSDVSVGRVAELVEEHAVRVADWPGPDATIDRVLYRLIAPAQ